MGLFGMLFMLIKLVKIGKGMASYTLGYSFLIKLPEYSNIIRIPIRIFEYQFWQPSLEKTNVFHMQKQRRRSVVQ